MTARKLPTFRDECRHFTVIQHDACGAGVSYRALVGEAFGWARRLPCLEGSPSLPRIDPVTCPKRDLMTQEDHEARMHEFDAAIEAAAAAVASGRCHVCGSPIEPSRKVGACRYASCGHRVGQVGDANSEGA